jgi:uncharacterized protein with NRDE domain
MCTLAIYLRQFEKYPVVIAANRDEHFARPSEAPKLWKGDPAIVAGKDLVAGGTWLGVNSAGIAAAIVNRRLQTEAPAAPRSRGLLCLDMLEAATLGEARAALPYEDAGRYQPFLLLVASGEGAFAVYNASSDVELIKVPPGLHVFSNTSFTIQNAEKLERAQQLFALAGEALGTILNDTASLEPAVGVLHEALRDHTAGEMPDAKGALCVHVPGADYGTVSSSIIFQSQNDKRFYYYHASGPPCRTDFHLAAELPIG